MRGPFGIVTVAIILLFSSGVQAMEIVQVTSAQAEQALQVAYDYAEFAYSYQGQQYTGMPYLLGGRTTRAEFEEALIRGESIENLGLDASGRLMLPGGYPRSQIRYQRPWFCCLVLTVMLCSGWYCAQTRRITPRDLISSRMLRDGSWAGPGAGDGQSSAVHCGVGECGAHYGDGHDVGGGILENPFCRWRPPDLCARRLDGYFVFRRPAGGERPGNPWLGDRGIASRR